MSASRPPEILSMFAAALANSAGWWKLGRTATISSIVRGHCRKRRRGRPGVERGLLDALDVVEVQLGDQRQVPAGLLAALGEALHIVPARLHPLVGDVAQPAAEHRHPVAEPHAAILPFIARFEEVDEPVVRVPAEHVQRIGDEIGHGVDVVEARRAVAVVDRSLRRRRRSRRAAWAIRSAARTISRRRRRPPSCGSAAAAGLRDAGVGRAEVEAVAAALDLDRVEEAPAERLDARGSCRRAPGHSPGRAGPGRPTAGRCRRSIEARSSSRERIARRCRRPSRRCWP